jgi:SAM-dependent methyltransferase
MKNEQCWSGHPQVNGSHYFSPKYLSRARFEGLQAQLEICLQTDSLNTFLEIGPGPGLLTALLRHFNYDVCTLDLDNELHPDTLGCLPNLPFRSSAFDVVCAFQVLEHIPMNLLQNCLSELRRVAKKKVLVSLPSQQEISTSEFRVDMIIGRRKYHQKFWRKPLGTLTNENEHFWELEHNGITSNTVIEISELAGLTNTLSKFVPPWFQMFTFDVNIDGFLE